MIVAVSVVVVFGRLLVTTTVVNSALAYGPDRQVCIALNGHPEPDLRPPVGRR